MLNIAINIIILQYPIMPALCLMLSMTHYAQNYAGIIGGSLAICILKAYNIIIVYWAQSFEHV